MSQELKNDFLS